MKPVVDLDRNTAAWCAIAVTGALVPLAQLLPPWLCLLLFVLAATGALFGWRGRTVSAWVRLPLTLGVAAAVLFAYGFRFGRDTGAALLVTMLALKLLETRHVRDARSVCSFALFAVMAGLLQDQAPTTLLLALGATLLIICALARIAEWETTRRSAVATLPAAQRLLISARIAALSIPLAIVGFFLFPRLGSPLWGLPENAASARSGLSDEMAPGDIANLYADDTPVLRILFEGAPPPQSAMYWRGPALSRLVDGRRWTRSIDEAGLAPASLQPLGPAIEYEVTQEPTDRRYLMTLDVAAVAPANSRLTHERMASTRRPLSQMTRYRARSHLRYRLGADLSLDERRTNALLPVGFNPRTGELVRQWILEGDSDEQLIQRALRLFNAEFTYTLQPMLLGRHSVDDFLFSTRQGYCEHFASAFVVMMRFAGIPARVVTGYQGGRRNEVGDYWVVRQSDAHAWAEVWLEGSGWVRVDPTSAVAPERIERGTEILGGPESAWSRYSQPLFDASDWLRRGWNDMVLGFNAARQRNLLQSFGIPEATTSQLGVALAVGVALALLVTVAVLLRRPRGPHDPLRNAWLRFLARLAAAGLRKAPSEGSQAFGARAARTFPHASEQILSLSQRYARRRYAAVVIDPVLDAALCDDLRRFRVPHATQRNNRRSA